MSEQDVYFYSRSIYYKTVEITMGRIICISS